MRRLCLAATLSSIWRFTSSLFLVLYEWALFIFPTPVSLFAINRLYTILVLREPRIIITAKVIESFQNLSYIGELRQRWEEIKKLQLSPVFTT